MKLVLEIGGERFEVDVDRVPGGLRVTCEGEARDWRVQVDGATVLLEGTRDGSSVRMVSDSQAIVAGAPLRFRLADFQPGPATGAAGPGGRTMLRAMMPGRVVRVLASQGASVKRGEPVLVLESMKMQNELVSPADGRFAVSVREGDVVEAGRVLGHVEA